MNAQVVLSDQELIKQYLDGKESAIERLICKHRSKVYSYILFNVKDRDLTEDIFQDTFIKVVNTLKKGAYNDEGKFLPWVTRIAHNLIIDHYRKSNRMQVTRSTEEFDIFSIISNGEHSSEQRMIGGQLNSELRKMIRELPADQKEVLFMRMFYDMSFKEIADRTNVSINTALGRMRYALINLRKMMSEKNIVLNM